MRSSSDRTPWSVVIATGLWCMVLLAPATVVLRDTSWPWAEHDSPYQAVLHIDNQSGGRISVGHRWDHPAAEWSWTDRLGPSPAPDSSSWRAPRSHYEMLTLVRPLRMFIRVEFEPSSGLPTVETSVQVSPGEHLGLEVTRQGVVSLARGHQSWLGPPVFDQPRVALGSP